MQDADIPAAWSAWKRDAGLGPGAERADLTTQLTKFCVHHRMADTLTGDQTSTFMRKELDVLLEMQ